LVLTRVAEEVQHVPRVRPEPAAALHDPQPPLAALAEVVQDVARDGV